MGANGIELPEFINAQLIERTYQRTIALRARGENDRQVRALLVRGMNMARDRNPRMLLFLEKGAEWLRKESEQQRDRMEEAGHQEAFARGIQFTEYEQWRIAYEKATAPEQDDRLMYRTLGWIYAAVAEALG